MAENLRQDCECLDTHVKYAIVVHLNHSFVHFYRM